MDAILSEDIVGSLTVSKIKARQEALSNGVCSSLQSVIPQIATLANPCLVVVPTYNERENIVAMIHAIKSLPLTLDILVVDDNSPDGTAKEVENLTETIDGLYLLKRSKKIGLGSAYKAGFSFALQHGWEFIIQMDADFSHNPQDVPRLVAACKEGADIVIGSRYVKGGRIEGWPLKRKLISRIANMTAQFFLGTAQMDLTGGFKCYSRQALTKINPALVSSEGYIFQVEMNYRGICAGLHIQQMAITFKDRRKGNSKMGWSEAVLGVCQLMKLQRNNRRSTK